MISFGLKSCQREQLRQVVLELLYCSLSLFRSLPSVYVCDGAHTNHVCWEASEHCAFYYSPSYFLETKSLLNLGPDWWLENPGKLPVSGSYSAGVISNSVKPCLLYECRGCELRPSWLCSLLSYPWHHLFSLDFSLLAQIIGVFASELCFLVNVF